MRLRPFRRSPREPTITLINVVFLMLIFFLVAGTIAPARDGRLKLVTTADLAAVPPTDGVLVLQDGTLMVGGRLVSLEAAAQADGPVRLLPDRALPADALIRLARDLRAAGAADVIVIGERSGP